MKGGGEGWTRLAAGAIEGGWKADRKRSGEGRTQDSVAGHQSPSQAQGARVRASGRRGRERCRQPDSSTSAHSAPASPFSSTSLPPLLGRLAHCWLLTRPTDGPSSPYTHQHHHPTSRRRYTMYCSYGTCCGHSIAGPPPQQQHRPFHRGPR